MNTDIRYTFNVTGQVEPDYRFAVSIIDWLVGNLKELTTDEDDKLFNEVNIGYNEESLKSFGKKPVCDVYFNNVNYDTDFDEHTPETVNSIVIYYLKGANNPTYMKACEIHDYITQEFLKNDSFKRLNDIVRDTFILNSEIQPSPVGKRWGVMGIFELSHILYQD